MNFPETYKKSLVEALDRIPTEGVSQAIDWFREARDEGRQIFVCGNGGSAATASHFATDMVKGASLCGGSRFKILALTDSLSTLTAYSNDFSYECVFVEQLKNFAKAGDLVMVISGSGNSPNVVKAVEYGNEAGCRTIALSGRDGGKIGKLAQLNLQVSEPHMGRIEDAHMVMCHMIAYAFMDGAA
jgi:D-sedoheptulose 7-phosphate isomerase